MLFIILLSALFAGFPDIVKDIEGNKINLKELSSQKTVVVITMKSADCSVCQNQIVRIVENLDKLTACNATFLVLAPGPISKIKDAKLITKFPFPFIMDNNLEISKSLDLTINDKQILPSLLILNNKLDVEWQQLGRNAFYFGDPQLMKRIHCYSI